MPASLISIGQVVDQSVHHYRKFFKTLMGISLYLFAGMPFIIGGTLIYSADNVTRLMVSVACEVIGFVITIVASYWVFNALALSVSAQTSNKKSDAGTVGKTAWRYVLPAIAISVLIAAMLLATLAFLLPGWALFFIPSDGSFVVPGIGVILFVVGGIVAACACAWVSVTYIFAPYALVLEGAGVRGALQRARDLVRGRWWQAMLRVVIPKIVILIVALFLQYVLIIVLSLLSAGTGPDSLLFFVILANLAKVGFSVLVTPLFVIADYYVFRSLVDTAKKAA